VRPLPRLLKSHHLKSAGIGKGYMRAQALSGTGFGCQHRLWSEVAAVQTVEQAMPLERLEDDHRRGVEFRMADEGGSPVFCRVSQETLRDQAARVHFEGTDDKVFEAYRELIEQVASDTFDAGVNVDEAGCILVTKEALDRVARSA
jgi:Protein of unknown function (DUF1488)